MDTYDKNDDVTAEQPAPIPVEVDETPDQDAIDADASTASEDSTDVEL